MTLTFNIEYDFISESKVIPFLLEKLIVAEENNIFNSWQKL